jgi:hypothetical protein
VLFARADSNYKALPGCDVWDIERDALRWPGGAPVIAHPPCRAWGSLRHFAKPRPGEKELALWAVEQVRRFGGVLEHPAASTLWPVAGLPAPGAIDGHGGFTFPIDQDWFGHRAQKATRLYIVGCAGRDLPKLPMRLEEPSHVVSPSRNIRAGMRGYRPQLRKAEREHTPLALAHWLVEVARRAAK